MHWLLKRAVTFFVAIPTVAYLVYNKHTVGFVLTFAVCLALVEYWDMVDLIMNRVSMFAV